MLKTVGILSILEGDAFEKTKDLWKLFETEYDSIGAQSFEYPNLTFQIGECQDTGQIENLLKKLCEETGNFEVCIEGLGYFDSPAKVIYLKIKPTEEILNLNRVATEILKKSYTKISDYYLPQNWIPHVTLAMTDLTDRNFDRAIEDLKNTDLRFKSEINNLHFVQQRNDSETIEIVRSFNLA
jgi:2'-5' RNA ligase